MYLSQLARQRRYLWAAEGIDEALAWLGEIAQDDVEREIDDHRTDEVRQLASDLEDRVARVHELAGRDPVAPAATLDGRD